MRIEDDILVTKRGPEVLTAAAPKSIRDVEALMRGALSALRRVTSVPRRTTRTVFAISLKSIQSDQLSM